MAPLPSPESNGGFNIFAAKACQCLRALGSVMVMIVLSLILLTYYTTVFAVYGRIALSHNSKSQAATGVIVVYNFLVWTRRGVSALPAPVLRPPFPPASRYLCCCGAISRRC